MSIIPRKTDKGFKSTMVAYVALFLILSCLVALFLKIITGSEFQEILTGIVAGAVVVLGFLTKDADKSHSDK